MRRRCNALNESVYMKYNTKVGLGSTLMHLMLNEAKEFCSKMKASWSSSPHQQVNFDIYKAF